MLGIDLKQVRSHKAFILFLLFVWQIFPSCNPAATSFRATHALLREIINTVISHSIIEGYFLINADISYGHKVMGTSFIYSNTTIRVTGMINLTYQSSMKYVLIFAYL